MSKAKSDWDAETARLAGIERSYARLKKQVQKERELGVHYVSRTDDLGFEQYRLIDELKRQLTPEFGTYMEAWIYYLGEKRKD